MTIHKAKGLGFPVVIVLLYGEKNRGFGYTVTRQDGELRLVKLTRHLARGDERLGALYDEQPFATRSTSSTACTWRSPGQRKRCT